MVNPIGHDESPPLVGVGATPERGHSFVRQRLIYAGIFDESTRPQRTQTNPD
jgi:hypothetical protein